MLFCGFCLYDDRCFVRFWLYYFCLNIMVKFEYFFHTLKSYKSVSVSFFKVQLTDFENAAYVTFVVLLTRVILSFDLNLLIPLSKVRTENV